MTLDEIQDQERLIPAHGLLKWKPAGESPRPVATLTDSHIAAIIEYLTTVPGPVADIWTAIMRLEQERRDAWCKE